jgi:ribosomal protein L31
MRTPVVLVAGQGDADGIVDVLASSGAPVVVRHRFDGQVVVRSVTTRQGSSEWPLELTRGCVACTVRDDLLVLLRTYPLVVVDISSASHPFWTGSRRHIDTAGQVEKFRRRYGGRT